MGNSYGALAIACGFAIVFASQACGLDVIESPTPLPEAFDASASFDAMSTNNEGGVVGTEAAVGAPCAHASGSSCTSSLPIGWSLIAFASTRAEPCPNGFAPIIDDVVLQPSASPPSDACKCTCTISPTDPPSCAQGALNGSYGTSTTCNVTGVLPRNINGTTCNAIGATAISEPVALFTPLPLTPGTCIPAAAIDKGVAAVLALACAPSAECAESICSNTPPEGFSSCILHDDDVSCPSGTPFVRKTLTGKRVDTTCGGCASCKNTAACSTPTIHYYSDSMCATQVTSFVVNGVCNTGTGAKGLSESYYKYDVTMTNPACAPTSTPTATASLIGLRTICCR